MKTFLAVLATLLAVSICLADQQGAIKHKGRLPMGVPTLYRTDIPKIYSELGEILFYSTELSPRKLSCASCHEPQYYTSTPRSVVTQRFPKVSLKREIPPIFNLSQIFMLMWDGRAQGLMNQVLLPLESQCEMDINWESSLTSISNLLIEKLLIPSKNIKNIGRTVIQKALAEYVGRIVSGDSRFDLYFYGDDNNKLSIQEKKGLTLFRGKARCSSCHLIGTEYALFTDGMLHTLGIGYNSGVYSDVGRYSISNNRKDIGAFRTPTLRNITRTAPYMHDGTLPTLRDVIDFYNKGAERTASGIDPKLGPLGLSEEEIQDLLKFLNSLESDVVLLPLE